MACLMNAALPAARDPAFNRANGARSASGFSGIPFTATDDTDAFTSISR
jgi:hypothetical protein